MAYSEVDLLKIVRDERKRSIGFGDGDAGELTASRETALAFKRGDMLNVPSEHRVPALPGRSKAVDTTVSDSISTLLPDLLEVFIGGDDVATFIPNGAEDEKACQEETDFVNHVVFVENPGAMILHTAFDDALTVKTGIIHWWMEDEEKTETKHTLSPEEADQAPLLQAISQLQGGALEPEAQDDGSVDLNNTTLHGKLKIRAFPPEDFSVAPDTVALADTTYCVVRDRPRVQDLIARGVDAKLARALKPYAHRDGAVELARDNAGEHLKPTDDGTGDLRTVEVRAHYIRLADDTGKLKIWRVVTDCDESTVLHKDECDHIPFAALCPFPASHRFYGESIADRLIEPQKVKTAIVRAHLDNIYFGLNQRMEVSMAKANEFTIADLLRNEPGVPVRVAQDGAVRAISAGALNVDTLASLEYFDVAAEKRSGVVRNAQGLAPDTLHKTASGMQEMVAAAQKRVRLIARIFAEGGLKDMFIGVHCMLRNGYTDKHAPASAKLGNSWKTIRPNTWPERCAMTIHVGVGSAGKEHDRIVATQRLEMMQAAVVEQGGLTGPIVDAKNMHAAFTDWERAAGSKKADAFWTDPENAQPQPPKPDPEMAKVQAGIELERTKADAATQLAREKAVADLQTQREQLAAKAEADREAAINAHTLKMEQLREELQMEREKLAIQLENQREIEMIKARNAHDVGMAKVSASVDQVEAGGEPG